MLFSFEENDAGSNPAWGVKGLKTERENFLKAIFFLKRTLLLVYFCYLRKRKASMLPRLREYRSLSFLVPLINRINPIPINKRPQHNRPAFSKMISQLADRIFKFILSKV